MVAVINYVILQSKMCDERAFSSTRETRVRISRYQPVEVGITRRLLEDPLG